MTHSLGVYYAPEHGFQVDRDYIAALQPPVIRILDPDVQQIHDMHALAPNAIIAPRTWAIDDGSDEDHPSKQVNRFMADPVSTGRDHAEQYKGQWDRWQQEAAQRGLKLPPVERILFNSANEPNQGGTPDKIAAYCVAFFDRCTELSIRACGPCLGVGWPDNNGPDTPVDWSPYANAGLEQAIQRNGGMLSVHEYFYKSGPQDNWRWLAGRHLQCPFDVPILLGEIGIDNYVDAPRWGKEGGNRGWQGNVSPEQYAEMIERHIRGCDPRVKAALPFITDFRNNSWESFNTRAAHGALLARKDNMMPQGKPSTVHLPSVSAPSVPVEDKPVDNWQRSREFVKRWEGGLSLNPEDHGNWTGGRKGVGELRGTNFGISAASYPYLDIRNITIEQADEIYFRDYWQASGADKLAWPYCLLAFDTAVLHGVGTSQRWQSQVGDNAYAFAAKRLRVYTKLDNWNTFGAGWTNRVADLLEVASQE